MADINAQEFKRLATIQALCDRRVTRAKAKLDAAETEVREAQKALRNAQESLSAFVHLEAQKTAEPDLFDTEEAIRAGIQDAGLGEYLRSVRREVDQEERQDAVDLGKGLHLGEVTDLAPQRAAAIFGTSPVRPDPTLVVEVAGADDPVPPAFHEGKCSAGECVYGQADCPVMAAAPKLAQPEPDGGENYAVEDLPLDLQAQRLGFGEWAAVQMTDGSVAIVVGAREVARGGGLGPLMLPAGVVEDLAPAPLYHLWWSLASSAWRASADEAEASGPARINIGTVEGLSA